MKRLPLIVVACFVLVGCSARSTYVDLYDFTDQMWTKQQSVVFDFRTIVSPVSGDVRLSLRYLPTAIGQKARLAIKTTNSDNVFFVDTLDIVFDRGTGDGVRSREIVVRKNVIWPKNAHNYITLVPNRTLHDVVSVSLEIDNATQY